MKISMLNNLNLKIDDDLECLKEINEHFTAYVPNYYHMPTYKSGIWNGKVNLFNINNCSLPYGLLSDLVKFYKKTYPRKVISIDKSTSNIYRGEKLTPVYNLSKYPHYYQKDCIESSLYFSKGLIRSATASGKCSFNIEIEVEVSDEIYEKYFKDYEKII